MRNQLSICNAHAISYSIKSEYIYIYIFRVIPFVVKHLSLIYGMPLPRGFSLPLETTRSTHHNVFKMFMWRARPKRVFSRIKRSRTCSCRSEPLLTAYTSFDFENIPINHPRVRCMCTVEIVLTRSHVWLHENTCIDTSPASMIRKSIMHIQHSCVRRSTSNPSRYDINLIELYAAQTAGPLRVSVSAKWLIRI